MSKETTKLFILLNSNNLDELRNRLTKDNVNVIGGSGQTLLHVAVSRSNADAVRLLISMGANVDARSSEGNTALIAAASRHNYYITTLLLEAAANPNIRGSNGMTAIRWAVTNPKGDFRPVPLLLEHGADPWIEDDTGGHAVNYAEMVHPELAEELKRARPQV